MAWDFESPHAPTSYNERRLAMVYLDLFLLWLSRSDRLGHTLMRLAIASVFLWIGAIKFTPYEADSITPFVANNPVLSRLYKYPE
jgi:uncharacterized membrane protein YkgB